VLNKSFDKFQPRNFGVNLEKRDCTAVSEPSDLESRHYVMRGDPVKHNASFPRGILDEGPSSLTRPSLLHKAFTSPRRAVWFIFQLLVLASIEGFEMALLHSLYLALEEAMPGKIPPYFPSKTVILFIISLLKSFWPDIPFWGALIWTWAWRVGIRVARKAIARAWGGWVRY
jgi:hypothetical protein